MSFLRDDDDVWTRHARAVVARSLAHDVTLLGRDEWIQEDPVIWYLFWGFWTQHIGQTQLYTLYTQWVLTLLLLRSSGRARERLFHRISLTLQYDRDGPRISRALLEQVLHRLQDLHETEQSEARVVGQGEWNAFCELFLAKDSDDVGGRFTSTDAFRQGLHILQCGNRIDALHLTSSIRIGRSKPNQTIRIRPSRSSSSS